VGFSFCSLLSFFLSGSFLNVPGGGSLQLLFLLGGFHPPPQRGRDFLTSVAFFFFRAFPFWCSSRGVLGCFTTTSVSVSTLLFFFPRGVFRDPHGQVFPRPKNPPFPPLLSPFWLVPFLPLTPLASLWVVFRFWPLFDAFLVFVFFPPAASDCGKHLGHSRFFFPHTPTNQMVPLRWVFFFFFRHSPTTCLSSPPFFFWDKGLSVVHIFSLNNSQFPPCEVPPTSTSSSQNDLGWSGFWLMFSLLVSAPCPQNFLVVKLFPGVGSPVHPPPVFKKTPGQPFARRTPPVWFFPPNKSGKLRETSPPFCLFCFLKPFVFPPHLCFSETPPRPQKKTFFPPDIPFPFFFSSFCRPLFFGSSFPLIVLFHTRFSVPPLCFAISPSGRLSHDSCQGALGGAFLVTPPSPAFEPSFLSPFPQRPP